VFITLDGPPPFTPTLLFQLRLCGQGPRCCR